MNIFIITEHLEDSSVGFANYFHPEAYSDKDTAETRKAQLEKDLGKYSGRYYLLDTAILNHDMQ